MSESNKNILFLDLLRGVAALLVFYDHVVIKIIESQSRWFVHSWLNYFIAVPFSIIQNFGFLGVAIFFLISGYIITHVARREDRKSFIIKRLFRIYPPLIASILIIIVFYKAHQFVTGHESYISHFSWSDFLWSFTLINYLFVNNHQVNGVAWSLVIEMIFYLFCLIILPWIKSRPHASVLLLSAFSFLVILNCRGNGDNFFLFAANVAYLPVLGIGQLLYYLQSKLVTAYYFIVYLVINILITVFGIYTIHSQFLPNTNSYGVSLAYAFFIFVICLLLNEKLRIDTFTKFFAKVSYSMYLNHGTVGIFVVGYLLPKTGPTIAIIIGFFATIGLCYLLHRFIEEPSRVLARIILNMRIRKKPILINNIIERGNTK